jgi:hypothetical protein
LIYVGKYDIILCRLSSIKDKTGEGGKLGAGFTGKMREISKALFSAVGYWVQTRGYTRQRSVKSETAA